MTAPGQSNDATQKLNFKEISITIMGNTNIKYCSDPDNILGGGRSAYVYPGYHFGIGKPVAVKFVKSNYLRIRKDNEVDELKIWSKIDQHPHIVRLYDSYPNPRGGLFLAMEMAERTFRQQIENCNPNREDVIKWLFQVSKAVECLHCNGVIHRDIKPDNILMILQAGNLVAKLADFGVSRMISSAELTGTFSYANGTLLWMAPEALENEAEKFKNTRMLDIFALGMTIYFGISKGRHPFISSNDRVNPTQVLFEMTESHINPNKLGLDQHAANNLLSAMIQRNPKDRPNISHVLSHCLFWNWEKEHQFLIRTAICLGNENCDDINVIKADIDYEYEQYYSKLYPEKIFNWIEIAKENNFDVVESLFSSKKRKKPTNEYGNGESVSKFLKLFRDKYVHYPEMNGKGALVFSDNDGSFCEESYVKILTSVCPGLTSVLYQELSLYTHVRSLLPLSKIYFLWQLDLDDEINFEEAQVRLKVYRSRVLQRKRRYDES